MRNISNRALFQKDCTKCPTCRTASWYIMKCSCGKIFCDNCGNTRGSKNNNDTLIIICPTCGKEKIYM
jgi:hypothetical protein